jgi:L-fucose mutarotase
MLKGIPHILGPDLLHALQAMGHGDELTIVDGNYPGASAGPRLIRADGHSGTDLLEAILTLMPLDDFVPDPAIVMQVVGDAAQRPPIVEAYAQIVARFEPAVELASLERFAFYRSASTATSSSRRA